MRAPAKITSLLERAQKADHAALGVSRSTGDRDLGIGGAWIKARLEAYR